MFGVPGAIILVLVGVLVWKRKSRKTYAKRQLGPLSELPTTEPDSLAELENNIPPQELPIERRLELPSD